MPCRATLLPISRHKYDGRTRGKRQNGTKSNWEAVVKISDDYWKYHAKFTKILWKFKSMQDGHLDRNKAAKPCMGLFYLLRKSTACFDSGLTKDNTRQLPARFISHSPYWQGHRLVGRRNNFLNTEREQRILASLKCRKRYSKYRVHATSLIILFYSYAVWI